MRAVVQAGGCTNCLIAGPRSLIGVDISPAMLLLAADKLDHNCDLRLGSCAALPVGDTTTDMVMSSFVVSYLDDLERLCTGD